MLWKQKVKLTMRVVSQGGGVVFGGCGSQAGGVHCTVCRGSRFSQLENRQIATVKLRKIYFNALLFKESLRQRIKVLF